MHINIYNHLFIYLCISCNAMLDVLYLFDLGEWGGGN